MSEKRDPLLDYMRGRGGDWTAPGWGQVGYASHENEQRRKRESQEFVAKRRPRGGERVTGGLLVPPALAALGLSCAQLAGFDAYGAIVGFGYLTRYAQLPAALVLVISLFVLVIGARYASTIDRVIVLGGLALLGANLADIVQTPWSAFEALIR